MLTLEEMSALRVCVGAAIGEFGASETTDLALLALAKIEAAQPSVQSDGSKREPTIITEFPMRNAYPEGHKPKCRR